MTLTVRVLRPQSRNAMNVPNATDMKGDDYPVSISSGDNEIETDLCELQSFITQQLLARCMVDMSNDDANTKFWKISESVSAYMRGVSTGHGNSSTADVINDEPSEADENENDEPSYVNSGDIDDIVANGDNDANGTEMLILFHNLRLSNGDLLLLFIQLGIWLLTAFFYRRDAESDSGYFDEDLLEKRLILTGLPSDSLLRENNNAQSNNAFSQARQNEENVKFYNAREAFDPSTEDDYLPYLPSNDL